MTDALRLRTVCVRMGQTMVLDGIDATLPAGQLTGIVGPNGAGKTTLLRAAQGLVPISAGEIRLFDKPLTAWRRPAQARALAYLPQGGDAKWPMRGLDVVLLGRLPHRSRLARPASADLNAAYDALERCDALAFAERRLDGLSSGERARVLLARALATQAPLLLADEPAAFLDPAHQIALMDVLRAEAARGTAVGVTLHDLPLAAAYCDRLIVLAEGKVAGIGPAATALSDEILAGVFSVTLIAPAEAGRFSTFRKI